MAVFLSLQGMAQTCDLEEKATYTDNGFECGYIIKNEQTKKAGDSAYSLYEITFFMINKSGCYKIYRDRNSSSAYDAPNLLLNFNCRMPMAKGLPVKAAI